MIVAADPPTPGFTLDPDAIAPAEPEISRASDSTLSGQSIREALRAHFRALRLCFDHANAPLPHEGHPTYRFTIGADGAVISTAIQGFGADVDTCLAAEMKRVTFPPGPTPVEVSYPWTFR
ncbi:MAG TPA: hypothetical protein VGM90_21640 [Kofleriaceae bacterium]